MPRRLICWGHGTRRTSWLAFVHGIGMEWLFVCLPPTPRWGEGAPPLLSPSPHLSIRTIGTHFALGERGARWHWLMTTNAPPRLQLRLSTYAYRYTCGVHSIAGENIASQSQVCIYGARTVWPGWHVRSYRAALASHQIRIR